MNNKFKTKNIFIGYGVLFFLLTPVFCVFVFNISEDIAIRYSVIVFSGLILILNILLVFLLRKKILLFTDELNLFLEKMISEEKNVAFDFNRETLFDKIGFKLKRLYEILNNNKIQLELEKQEIEEMISDISHQIKTPIANLKMYNSTIITREIPLEKMREFHILMEKQIDKLDFLTASMIKVSRLEVGTVHLNIKLQNLYDTVALALSGIVLSAEMKNISVITPQNNNIVIPHDSKWTAEAIFNILDNAVKYTPIGGIISIEIDRWEMTTKIEITDSGKGILEENYSKIFKRFFREEDVDNIEGIGIGLYLTREIISKQKGYLQVKSEINKGSTFRIFLPNE